MPLTVRKVNYLQEGFSKKIKEDDRCAGVGMAGFPDNNEKFLKAVLNGG